MMRARYTTQAGRARHSSRPNRESISKRLGRVALQIRERDGHACVYCGATEKSSGAHLHFDHLTPRSQGGSDEPTNLALACRSCNSRRQNKSLAQWARVAVEMTFTARSIRAQARRRLPEVSRG